MAKSTRRESMLDAGLSLLRTRALRDITLDDVAEIAGTTRSLVLYYFKTRDNFFFELADDYVSSLMEEFGPPPGDASSEWIVGEVNAFLKMVRRDTAVVEAITVAMGGIEGVRELNDRITAFTAERVALALGVKPGDSFLTPVLQSWGRACVDVCLREISSGQRDMERLRSLILGHLTGVLQVVAAYEPSLHLQLPDFSPWLPARLQTSATPS
ncbi:TetR/AcrR family transcriptional regulator [Streptomyces griseorubiginosus]|uniref:TetR/AcrR family transcriptional regulator n=1 Tax=Streptomyces griseorubiginosus TaxID=67304 RepID=UPI001AD7BA50|nr:helix-turn-helix domain-containing protein [Streptomyces griseorubiginosus]MBO4256367.1 TetR family transcriptional regulator [Streptomyces griseorubiginosus]